MNKIFLLVPLVLLSVNLSANQLSIFNQMAEKKGAALGVNPNLIRSIISVESAGKMNAVSNKGALGLMQLMPATAERMGIPKNELFDPERNMEAGVRYLAYLNRLFNYNPVFVIAAYNAGEGAVRKYGGVPPYKETQNYVPSVIARFNLLNSCGLSCYTSQYMRSSSKVFNPTLQSANNVAQKDNKEWQFSHSNKSSSPLPFVQYLEESATTQNLGHVLLNKDEKRQPSSVSLEQSLENGQKYSTIKSNVDDRTNAVKLESDLLTEVSELKHKDNEGTWFVQVLTPEGMYENR